MRRSVFFPAQLPLIVLLVIATWAVAEFRQPTPKQQEQALGSLAALDPVLRKAFSAEQGFEVKKEPGGFDWLASHEESGQGYQDYLAARPNRPGEHGRSVLYLLPLGDFPKEIAPDLVTLKKQMSLYYAPMTVKILPSIPAEKVKTSSRENSLSGQTQWHSKGILLWLSNQLPRDSYGLLAVTMTDLYPGKGWNFVFGQATYKNRVGVFSFARFPPNYSVEELSEEEKSLLVLRRACKVLTHEMGHMFGIKHCIYYECNMNGANSLQEADGTPMHLCPVCLRKLQHAVGFDPESRYQDLEKFYEQNAMKEEAEWIGKRLKWLQAD